MIDKNKTAFKTIPYSKILEDYCINNKFEYERLDPYVILVNLGGGVKIPFIYFYGPSSSWVNQRILDYKHLTLDLLKNNNIKVSDFLVFKISDINTALTFADNKYPVVVKPINDWCGNNVFTNIKNSYELSNILQDYKTNSGWAIIEKHFFGEDFRAFVCDGELISLTKREAANVIGNGTDSVLQLIKKKNKERADNNFYLAKSLIPEDLNLLDKLVKHGLDLTYIPKKDEKLFLRGVTNVSAGGDSIDYTDLINDEIKTIAINSVKSIPCLVYSEVDILVKDYNTESFDYVVNEINFNFDPVAMYHSEGKSRDMFGPILTYYKKNYR